MRFKLKIFTSIVIIFFSFDILEIKSHNSNNGGCKEHCSTKINRERDEQNTKFFQNNEKSIMEQNSCLNNFLCRG